MSMVPSLLPPTSGRRRPSWRNLAAVVEAHPAKALLFSVIATLGVLIQLPASWRALSAPDPARLAGVDVDPNVTLTFIDGQVCRFTNEGPRPVVGVALKISSTIVDTANVALDPNGTQRGEHAAARAAELKFGEEVRVEADARSLQYLARPPQPMRWEPPTCLTPDTCRVFLTCTATYHRAGDGRAYRRRRSVVASYDEGRTVWRSLREYYSIRRHDDGTFTREWHDDEVLKVAYEMLRRSFAFAEAFEAFNVADQALSSEPMDDG